MRVLVGCDAEHPAPRLAIAVEDTGPALGREQLARLGATWSAGPDAGPLGLGLALCERLTALLGGEIRGTGTPGQGNRITEEVPTGPLTGVRLIRSPRAPVQPEPQSPACPGPPRGGLVLVVDDGADHRLLISTHLRRAGLRVVTAENGRVALSKVLMAQAMEEPFDLIFMDMQMPQPDGYEVMAQLRTQGYAGPIVALTAHALAGDRERCFAAGCDDYLAKPATRVQLVEMAARHLRPAAGEAAPGSEPSRPKAAQETILEPLLRDHAEDPELADPAARFAGDLQARALALLDVACRDDREALRRLAQ